MTMEEKYNTN